MARLTVEQEGQEARHFQLRPGRLSVGSGEEAKLSLPGSELAALHADLEVSKDQVVLRLRKGVRPAQAGGRSFSGEWTFAHGQAVDLGGVRMTVEYEGGDEKSLVARRNVTTKAQAARERSSGAAPASPARRAGAKGAAAPRVQRTRRPGSSSRSLPSWAILAIVAVVLYVGYRAFSGYADSVGDAGFDVGASLARIESAMKESDLVTAQNELDRVAAREDVPADQRGRFAALQAEVEERRRQGTLRVHHAEGSHYLEGQIRGYESKYLDDERSAPRVRVLLERLAHFRETWPEHPETAFVERMQERYGSLASLDDPPTLEDVDWKVHTMTWSMPRDYAGAYAEIRAFLARADGPERERAEQLLAEKQAEELEYAEDRLQQARYLWNQEDGESKGKAVEWLMQLVAKLENAEYLEKATTVLLAIPDLESRLRGYKDTRPEIWRELQRNERLAARIRSLGI